MTEASLLALKKVRVTAGIGERVARRFLIAHSGVLWQRLWQHYSELCTVWRLEFWP